MPVYAGWQRVLDLADVHVSQVQMHDHQGLEVAKKLWRKGWETAGQEPFKEHEVVAMTPPLALISVIQHYVKRNSK